MSWHYLPGLEAEFSAGSCSVGEPCAPLKSTPSVGRCCSDANWMDAYRSSLSGMTSEPLTANRGEDVLMSSAGDSLAKTYQLQEPEMGLMVTGQDSGNKCLVSLARLNQGTSLWKTHQCLLFEDSTESLVTFPAWGITVAGELYPLLTPVFPTPDKECGFFPTPRACVYKNRKWWTRKKYRGNLEEQPMIPGYEHLSGKPINPEWLEWIMGWVHGWTDLKPLETDKFQQWLDSHGKY